MEINNDTLLRVPAFAMARTRTGGVSLCNVAAPAQRPLALCPHSRRMEACSSALRWPRENKHPPSSVSPGTPALPDKNKKKKRNQTWARGLNNSWLRFGVLPAVFGPFTQPAASKRDKTVPQSRRPPFQCSFNFWFGEAGECVVQGFMSCNSEAGAHVALLEEQGCAAPQFGLSLSLSLCSLPCCGAY